MADPGDLHDKLGGAAPSPLHGTPLKVSIAVADQNLYILEEVRARNVF